MSALVGLQSAAAETCDEFWKVFNSSIAALRAEVQELPKLSEDANVIKEGLAAFKVQKARLQTYATESTKVLPPYDVRRSQEILEGVDKELKAMEQQLQPKKRFAFSSRAKAAAPSSSATPEVVEAKEERKDAPPPPGSFVISGVSNETLLYTEQQVRGMLGGDGDGDRAIGLYIQNTHHCSITLPMLLGSVRIEGVSHCSLYLGPVRSAVYVEQAAHCQLHLACHQLRIHNCSDDQLYVHVRSHPIIEDCSGMGFAPYSLRYRGLSEQMAAAALGPADGANHWDKVVDFRWHKSTPSPNWAVLQEAERRAPPTIALSSTSEEVEAAAGDWEC